MESRLRVRYSHRLLGHFPVDDIDSDYYKTLTGVEEEYVDSETGLPVKPIPSMDQILTVVGTTELSSKSIATTIKAWLEKSRTRISISDSQSRRKLEFEGPNLDKSVDTIKEMIDALVGDEATTDIGVRAVHI